MCSQPGPISPASTVASYGWNYWQRKELFVEFVTVKRLVCKNGHLLVEPGTVLRVLYGIGLMSLRQQTILSKNYGRPFYVKEAMEKKSDWFFLTFVSRPIPFTYIPLTGNECGRKPVAMYVISGHSWWRPEPVLWALHYSYLPTLFFVFRCTCASNRCTCEQGSAHYVR